MGIPGGLNMALSKTANASIRQLIHELTSTLPNAEEEALRAEPRGGEGIRRTIAVYENHLRQIADRCAVQCAWYYKNHPLNPVWLTGKKWQRDLSNYVKAYYEMLSNRLNAVVSRVEGPVTAFIEAQRQLDNVHHNVQERLWLNVEAQLGEGSGKWGKGAVGAVKWLALAGIGYVIGVGQNLTAEHFKPLVTKPSSCQSSSAVAPNNPAQPPQTSGTPLPSTPLSAGPPHATHPVPATPSSTRQP